MPGTEGGRAEISARISARKRAFFNDLFCICSICGREKQAEILGALHKFLAAPMGKLQKPR